MVSSFVTCKMLLSSVDEEEEARERGVDEKRIKFYLRLI
jgi:hypothetical protein